MSTDRRNFIRKTVAGLATLPLAPSLMANGMLGTKASFESKPWIELSKSAYLHNASMISRMAGGKPIVAVLKNNAYGLGEVEVAQALDPSEHIFGIAVVKDESAIAMRAAGVTKPILLMGDFDSSLFAQLTQDEVTLAVHSQSSFDKIRELAYTASSRLKVALYIDTGLGRMGIPWSEVVDLAQQVSRVPYLTIEQTFSTLTTPRDFAQEQMVRFDQITSELEEKGIPVGLKHLAPSFSLLDLPNSHQDAVRPGILIHGSFPLAKMAEAEQYPLQVPYRLKAPVIRLEQLKAGDTIGFSRFYKVEQDEWIATLPIGWADGYYSGAENGAKVLLGDRLYTVVNVNASHANISLGSTTDIEVGDIATLIGPERPEITPEGFGKLAGGHNYLQINYKESLTKHVHESF